jgi:hypothetical protein
MRTRFLHPLLSGVFIVFMAVLAGQAQTTQKAEKSTTIEGELVDLRCFVAMDARGEKHQSCAAACVKAGDPVGLVDAKGAVYTLASQTSAYVDHMAKTVRVTGMASGNVIVPTKMEVKEGSAWKEIKLPKEMM